HQQNAARSTHDRTRDERVAAPLVVLHALTVRQTCDLHLYSAARELSGRAATGTLFLLAGESSSRSEQTHAQRYHAESGQVTRAKAGKTANQCRQYDSLPPFY